MHRLSLALKSHFKDWNRNILLFFAASILYQIGTGVFSVLYNLYIHSLGYDDSMSGTIVSLQSLATALIFIPIGFMGDRRSRKSLLIIGALFTGVSFVFRSYSEGESTLILFAVLTGLFISIFQVLAIPFLAENSTKSQRLKLFSYHASLVLAAQVVGSVGGGMLADVMQHAGIEESASLQTVLLIGSLAVLLSFVPLLLIKDLPKQQEQPVQSAVPEVSISLLEEGQAQASKSDWRMIRSITFVQLLIGLGSGLVIPYLNLYFTNRFSMSLTAVGVLISLGQVMTIISMLIGPLLVRRVGQVKAVIMFQMMSLPFLVLTGFTNVLLIASISFLFRQALMNAANPIQSSILVERVSDRRRGIANSMSQTAFMLGWASMGSVQAYLVTTYGSYWGYAITFSITGGLYVVASLLYYVLVRERPTLSIERAAKPGM